MSDTLPYVTRHPMPVDKIVVGARVIVPVWQLGSVVGHASGEVIMVNDASGERFAVVRHADGVEAGHFPHAIMCDVCFDRTDASGCWNCKG